MTLDELPIGEAFVFADEPRGDPRVKVRPEGWRFESRANVPPAAFGEGWGDREVILPPRRPTPDDKFPRGPDASSAAG